LKHPKSSFKRRHFEPSLISEIGKTPVAERCEQEGAPRCRFEIELTS
jgi:hypothetical protein